jgi:chemotaxis-related protein WspD
MNSAPETFKSEALSVPHPNATPTVLMDFTVARDHEPRDELVDCWNRIGVSGNQTCRELPRHVHCHNCPVFSAAAARFLDRPLSAEDRQAWTEHYAPEKRLVTPAKTSVVLFRLGLEWLALPTAAFQEVAERRVLHSLPHRRLGIVLGLVNVRGELLLCASLARLLGREVGLPAKRLRAVFDRLLVADWNGQRFAFPVDEVHGVHRFHQADLREPPATVSRSGLHCTVGVFPWRNLAVGFLDADTIFTALNRSLA